ncbi:hypothetical protein BS47DRAFT_1371474 [Hydnum rufescens UP504]|uniref:Thioesterase domain-containing protein n=1 Tax=Hydnum rufescens UP504 TaxID=1448309 RepID=A0A9P6E0N3_9AGAM|nr:hypothetical protein BS47DRAFT_1371474 [Hydnum rufescens UP504]
MAACLRFSKRVWMSFADNGGHDARCIPNLQIHRAVPGIIECSLQIKDYNCQAAPFSIFCLETVHGGLLLSLVDTVGSLAVATRGLFMTGVSTDISGTFLRPAGSVGQLLFAKGSVVGLGKTLAYTRIEFTDEAGKLVAFGSHTKFIASTLNHEKNLTFSADGETVVGGKEE